MGPLATSDLFRKIIINTKANSDQEHIKILIDNNTDIPDRTKAILENGKNPLPQLLKSAVSLCSIGAEILLMPCNTAHYFYNELQKNIEIPILNMIEVCRDELIKKGFKKVGLLATSGTIKSGVYQKVFNNSGIEINTPNETEQTYIMDLIYKGVKAGNRDFDISNAKNVMDNLLNNGAEVLILGCTKLPVAIEMYKLDYPVCDPTLELAKAAVLAAGGTLLE